MSALHLMETPALLSRWAAWSAMLEEKTPYIRIDEDEEILGRVLNWQKPEDGIEFVFEKSCGACSNCNGVTCGGFVGEKITKAIRLEVSNLAAELDRRSELLGITAPDPETHRLQGWMIQKGVPND